MGGPSWRECVESWTLPPSGFKPGALTCYGLAAATAIASEGGGISSHVHRPFSIVTQVLIVWAIIRYRGKPQTRALLVLNVIALAAIVGDAALHDLLAP